MRIITLDLGLYGATVVLFHIISVVYLWLGDGGRSGIPFSMEAVMALRDLAQGMRGEDVRAVQQGLNEHFRGTRPELDPDGAFGPNTRAAVDAFQLANPGTGRPDGKPDGIVGRRTREKLFPLVVVTSTVVGFQLRPPRTPSLQDRVQQGFSPGQLRLGGQAPAALIAPVFSPFFVPRLVLSGFLTPISIPRLPDRIAAPQTPEAALPTPGTPAGAPPPAWRFDHAEIAPGGQVTFPFSSRRQDALALTVQTVFSRGPSDRAHLELTPGVTFGVPLNATPGDGSAWTFNPFVQITDVDRLGALGLFHLWQPYAQVGFQGSFARNVSPTLTSSLFPINLGLDAAKFLTITFGAGFVANLNLDTGAAQFGAQFSLGANFKFGAPAEQ